MLPLFANDNLLLSKDLEFLKFFYSYYELIRHCLLDHQCFRLNDNPFRSLFSTNCQLEGVILSNSLTVIPALKK